MLVVLYYFVPTHSSIKLITQTEINGLSDIITCHKDICQMPETHKLCIIDFYEISFRFMWESEFFQFVECFLVYYIHE